MVEIAVEIVENRVGEDDTEDRRVAGATPFKSIWLLEISLSNLASFKACSTSSSGKTPRFEIGTDERRERIVAVLEVSNCDTRVPSTRKYRLGLLNCTFE